MSKPIFEVSFTTLDEKTGTARAVFDTGSFYSILREDKLPPGTAVLKRAKPLVLRPAAKGTRLTAVADVPLVMRIGDKEIEDVVLVSPDLTQELLVGAGTMQRWDISVLNANGRTKVSVAHDRHDPEINDVL